MWYGTFIISPLLAIITTIIILYIKSKIEQLHMQIAFGYQLIKKRMDSLEDIESYINKLYRDLIDLKVLYRNRKNNSNDEEIKKLRDIVDDISDQIRTKAIFISKEYQSKADEIVSGLNQAINSNDIVTELEKVHGLIKEFEKEIIKFVSDHIPKRERKKVNLRKGFKRIIWIISVSSSIILGTYLVSTNDIKPKRIIDQEGIAFLKFLDGEKLSLDEWLLLERSKKLFSLKTKIATDINTYLKRRLLEFDSTSILPDSRGVKSRDVIVANNLKEIGTMSIKKAIPTLDTIAFKKRYNISDEGDPGLNTYKYSKLHNMFLDHKKLPIKKITIFTFVSLIPFVAIWLMWFL